MSIRTPPPVELHVFPPELWLLLVQGLQFFDHFLRFLFRRIEPGEELIRHKGLRQGA